MHSPQEHKRSCYCSEVRPHAILFNILNRETSSAPGDEHCSYSSTHHCHCQQQKLVCVRNPAVTSQAASAVLLKTIHFMRSLPAFQLLPFRDQHLLLRSCWVPLFVLDLTQEHMEFEVTDMPTSSILRKILLNDQRQENRQTDDSPPTLAAVHHLKSCLNKFWSLDLTPKEYAYLKGTILFNPDLCSMSSCEMIQELQKEAQRALHELIHTLHPNDPGRFTHLLLTASALQTVSQSFITELFFRPIIGHTDMNELLMEILFI